MTPVQYWLYTSAGLSTDLAIKMSFATTIAVILPTAASGTYRHHRMKATKWRIAAYMGVFTLLGGFVGANLAVHLPGEVLKLAFGAIGLVIGLRMLTVKISDVERPIRESPWLWIGLGFPIGVVTGILAIGGGIMVVPALALAGGFRMRNAVATSLGIMLFTSAGGIIGYIINGIGVTGLPEHTIGYIYWPAWLALTVSSIGTAQLGAIFAHRVPGRILSYFFIALIFYVGLDMLGAISWLAAHL